MKRLAPSIAAICLLAACGGNEADLRDRDPCSARIAPSGGDDQVRLQSALYQAGTGATLCLESGTFHLREELSLGVPGITLRGERGTLLDFAGQEPGGSGLFVTGDDIRVDRLAVRNTGGDAVRVVGADNVALRRLSVGWDDGLAPAEGSQAISLLASSNASVSATVIDGIGGAGIRADGLSDVRLRGNVLRGESSVLIGE